MNRRKLLSWLGLGAATVAVAPSVLSSVVDPVLGTDVREMSTVGLIDEWNTYVNFSSFAIAGAIDEYILNAAEQLGKAKAEEINRLYQTVNA
jgi:hypothetical protein